MIELSYHSYSPWIRILGFLLFYFIHHFIWWWYPSPLMMTTTNKIFSCDFLFVCMYVCVSQTFFFLFLVIKLWMSVLFAQASSPMNDLELCRCPFWRPYLSDGEFFIVVVVVVFRRSRSKHHSGYGCLNVQCCTYNWWTGF